MVETPPLARRKHVALAVAEPLDGNTSACAEKTSTAPTKQRLARKHLRLRGENLTATPAFAAKVETPPLARRKRLLLFFGFPHHRNTSARAEKTPRPTFHRGSGWKHLRARGENGMAHGIFLLDVETPPRARRKRGDAALERNLFGNTSARAEKTFRRVSLRLLQGKHLRARGENSCMLSSFRP